MKLLASSTLMWGRTIDEIGKIANERQLYGIELWTEQASFCQMEINDILRTMKQFELDVTVHAASWDLNICSLNEGIRTQSLKEIIRSFEFAAAINATNVTIHPGRRTLTNEWTPWHVEVLNYSLDRLEEAAKTYDITVSIELMEEIKKEIITDADDLNQLIDHRSQWIQTTFDVAHISLDKDIDDVFSQLHRVNKIHLSDSSASQYHVPLGEGELQLNRFMQRLVQENYPIVLEGYDASEEVCMLDKHLAYLQNHVQKAKEMSV